MVTNASEKRFFSSLETALSTSNVDAVEHAVEEAKWWTVNALRDRDESALRTLASECNAIGQRHKSSTEAWRAWCAGQLQMIAAVSRAALSLRLPRNVAAAVRERKNFLPILLTVGERELDATTVASSIGLSLSQTLRELESLESLKLVQTDKGNRRRWIRLTPLGHQAIAELGDTQREELTQVVAEARPFDDAGAFTVRLEEMAQRLDNLENTFTAKTSNVSELREGDVRAGIVTRVVDFGVFVDIGEDVEGLVHISHMGRRVNHPSELVSPGDHVVLEIDRVRGRFISLTLKHVIGAAQAPNESALEHAREVLDSEEAPDTEIAHAMERALVEEA